MTQPEHPPRTTTTSIDDGSDDRVTGAGAGTARDERGHHGEPRSPGAPGDAGATAPAARELDREDDDEPTRSE